MKIKKYSSEVVNRIRLIHHFVVVSKFCVCILGLKNSLGLLFELGRCGTILD